MRSSYARRAGQVIEERSKTPGGADTVGPAPGECAAAAPADDAAFGREPCECTAHCSSGNSVLAYESRFAGQGRAGGDTALGQRLREDGIDPQIARNACAGVSCFRHEDETPVKCSVHAGEYPRASRNCLLSKLRLPRFLRFSAAGHLRSSRGSQKRRRSPGRPQRVKWSQLRSGRGQALLACSRAAARIARVDTLRRPQGQCAPLAGPDCRSHERAFPALERPVER